MAKVETGPALHMDEAAFPAGPTGRRVLVQGLDSAENGDVFSCSSWRQEAWRPRRVAPKHQRP
eukprot:8810231-Alexandrium_andersonii.AAC.1